MTSTVKDPETIVRQFCATWAERSVEKLLGRRFATAAEVYEQPQTPLD